MKSPFRSPYFTAFSLVIACTSTALAGSDDPAPAGPTNVTVTVVPPPQPVTVQQTPPPAQPQVVYVQQQQPVEPQPQVVYVQDPPQVALGPRPPQNQRGFWVSARVGGSIDFTNLNPARVGSSAPVGSAIMAGAYGGVMAGFQTQAGFSFAGTVGGRYHVDVSGNGGASSGNGYVYRLSMAEALVLVRYTAFPLLSVHPFAEINIGLHLPIWSMDTSPTDRTGTAVVARFGLGATGGIELDVSRHVSLSVALRLDYLLGGADPASTTRGDPAGTHLLLTPLFGLTWNF